MLKKKGNRGHEVPTPAVRFLVWIWLVCLEFRCCLVVRRHPRWLGVADDVLSHWIHESQFKLHTAVYGVKERTCRTFRDMRVNSHMPTTCCIRIHFISNSGASHITAARASESGWCWTCHIGQNKIVSRKSTGLRLTEKDLCLTPEQGRTLVKIYITPEFLCIYNTLGLNRSYTKSGYSP